MSLDDIRARAATESRWATPLEHAKQRANARTDIFRLLAALDAVLGIHQPFEWSFGQGPVQSCKECVDGGMNEEQAQYPCPTVRAITAALEGGAE